MNIRHAAAFALVGWYLMLPLRKGTTVLVDAPIASWKHVDSFDSASECRDAALDFGSRAKKLFGANGDYTTVNQWNLYQCIASDDPRLKR
jgi:hypothetical protein